MSQKSKLLLGATVVIAIIMTFIWKWELRRSQLTDAPTPLPKLQEPLPFKEPEPLKVTHHQLVVNYPNGTDPDQVAMVEHPPVQPASAENLKSLKAQCQLIQNLWGQMNLRLEGQPRYIWEAEADRFKKRYSDELATIEAALGARLPLEHPSETQHGVLGQMPIPEDRKPVATRPPRHSTFGI